MHTIHPYTHLLDIGSYRISYIPYIHHSYIQTYSTSQKDIYLKPPSLAMWIMNAIEYAVIICLLSFYTAYLTFTVCTNAHMYVCMYSHYFTIVNIFSSQMTY